MQKESNNDVDLERLRRLPIINRNNPHKKYSEKEEKHLRDISTFEFYNLEEPGLMITFPYGSTTNKHTFKFMHGGKYKIPRFLARFVDSAATPLWGWEPDGTGSLQKVFKGWNSRFQMREVYD